MRAVVCTLERIMPDSILRAAGTDIPACTSVKFPRAKSKLQPDEQKLKTRQLFFDCGANVNRLYHGGARGDGQLRRGRFR